MTSKRSSQSQDYSSQSQDYSSLKYNDLREEVQARKLANRSKLTTKVRMIDALVKDDEFRSKTKRVSTSAKDEKRVSTSEKRDYLEELASQSLPRELRRLIYEYAEPRYANVFPISQKELEKAGILIKEWFDENLTSSFLSGIKDILIKRGDNPQRGDLISVEIPKEERNDGLLIYDGSEVRQLEHEPDEYGNIPREFKVITEFPIDYWHNDKVERPIVHNSIVWFDTLPFLDELIDNIKYEKVDGKFMLYTTFTYKRKPYRIIYSYPDTEYEDIDSETYALDEELLKQFKEDFPHQLEEPDKYLVYFEVYDPNYYLTHPEGGDNTDTLFMKTYNR